MNDKDDKATRLAAALRENLGRRKGRARALADAPPKADPTASVREV